MTDTKQALLTPADESAVAATADPFTLQGQPQPPTMQDLFDRAARGVILQGKKSVGSNGCAYRTASGLMCAVGQLITDEVYAEYNCGSSEFGENDLEGKIVAESIVRDALTKSLGYELDQRTLDMLAWVQKAHDDLDAPPDEDSPQQWQTRFYRALENIASVYGLSMWAVHKARLELREREAAAAVQVGG